VIEIRRTQIPIWAFVLSLSAMPVCSGILEAQDFMAMSETPLMPTITATTPTLRFALLEERLLAEPERYEVLWGAASEGARLAASLSDADERKALIIRARGYAERATTRAPDEVEGHYWLSVTSGLLAEEEGGRTKIRLAEQAWDESSWVLEVDPMHAGAHHIQGRLHAAVMRLNRVLRFLARRLLGGDVLGEASWDNAEYHLRLAAELAPKAPVHHLELGVAYMDLDREDEARAAFEDAVSAVPHYPADRRYMARAAELLAELQG
jgi:tetratricopeptide (TPR) repeat protein